MAKLSQSQKKKAAESRTSSSSNLSQSPRSSSTGKAKRTRKSVPRDSPPQRSSIYRGVTRFNKLNQPPSYDSLSFALG